MVFFSRNGDSLAVKDKKQRFFLEKRSNIGNEIGRKANGTLTTNGYLDLRIAHGTARYECNKKSDQVIAIMEKIEKEQVGAILGREVSLVPQTSSETVVVSDVTGQVQPQVTVSGNKICKEIQRIENRLRTNHAARTKCKVRPMHCTKIVQLKHQAKRLGLDCVNNETKNPSAELKSVLDAISRETHQWPSSKAESIDAKKEVERLRNELAAISANQLQVSLVDEQPKITISSVLSQGPRGVISGRVTGSAKIAELRIDGQVTNVDSNGNFKATTYVPQGGASVNIEAIDINAQSSTMSVRVDRATAQTATVSFDRLNPLRRKVAPNTNALALIIGVDSYKSTPARANYADSDAKVFADYASQKLGIPTNRIKTLVNDGAGEREFLLSVKSWLSRSVKQNQSDVYIFFAGHGLASDDGSKMYLLPYDGAPELLDDTAILRDRLFSDVAAANPRSVTVFLDTCYSGTTRGTDMLIASRPIAIRALEQSIPDNFTVMTAAAGDQTAKPLEEAKHGMFSYFLMKGMEGEADANNDNEITAGELHSYVQTNVIQQSSGSQTPELQGDADRVLVRFQ